MTDLYREAILEASNNPANKGSLANPDLQAEAVNASCGDAMKVYLKLTDELLIKEIKWDGDGCAISQAGMSLLSEHVKGMKLPTLAQLTLGDLKQLVGLDLLAPSREKCLMLGLRALHRAISTHRITLV